VRALVENCCNRYDFGCRIARIGYVQETKVGNLLLIAVYLLHNLFYIDFAISVMVLLDYCFNYYKLATCVNAFVSTILHIYLKLVWCLVSTKRLS